MRLVQHAHHFHLTAAKIDNRRLIGSLELRIPVRFNLERLQTVLDLAQDIAEVLRGLVRLLSLLVLVRGAALLHLLRLRDYQRFQIIDLQFVLLVLLPKTVLLVLLRLKKLAAVEKLLPHHVEVFLVLLDELLQLRDLVLLQVPHLDLERLPSKNYPLLEVLLHHIVFALLKIFKHFIKKVILGRDRTCNPQIRSLMRYQLRHKDGYNYSLKFYYGHSRFSHNRSGSVIYL